MSQFVNGAIMAIVAFIALISAFWFTTEIQREEVLTFTGMTTSWPSTEPAGSQWRFSITFHNPHGSYVELVGLEHEVLLNGERVALEQRRPSERFPPQANETTDISIALGKDFLANWWATHVRAGQETTWTVRGNATFMVLQRIVTVPYAAQSSWSADFTPLASPGPCPVDDTLCLQWASLSWTTGGPPALQLRMTASNTNGSLLVLRNWTAFFALQGIPVTSAELDASPIELPPHTNRELEFLLPLDFTRVASWWPVHVSACEQSTTLVQVQLVKERWLNGTQEADSNATEPATGDLVTDTVLWRIAGPLVATQFACPRM